MQHLPAVLIMSGRREFLRSPEAKTKIYKLRSPHWFFFLIVWREIQTGIIQWNKITTLSLRNKTQRTKTNSDIDGRRFSPDFAWKMYKDMPMYYSKTEEINMVLCSKEYASVFAWMIHISLTSDTQGGLRVSWTSSFTASFLLPGRVRFLYDDFCPKAYLIHSYSQLFTVFWLPTWIPEFWKQE